MFLRQTFLDEFKDKEVNWGFSSGPNSLGEVTYRRTYSRDGEQWWETVQRVVEGVYSIIGDHCERYSLPLDRELATEDAETMYRLIFDFKFLPPGRGLWMMGTDYVRTRGGAALNNCAFVSTEKIDVEFDRPFRFLMDMSMLGAGVGFDTRGAGKLVWCPSNGNVIDVQVEDSREGWVDSLSSLLKWAWGAGAQPVFDYSLIRPRGTKIKGFGGVSEGPDPLIKLHQSLFKMIRDRDGEKVTSRDITDIFNLIGVCVVSGNVRRSAEIAFGEPGDEEFLNLKNYDLNPERAEFGWSSNNSVFAEVGMDYHVFTDRIVSNGEPGFAWLSNMQAYGRMVDPPNNKDWRVRGGNPCLEQSLEPYEMCCLVETFPYHHETVEEYQRTLKYAYIYAKAVTLLATHWEQTNAVMLRNRRIGTSMSGITQFLAYRGEKELVKWCELGYETVQHYDRVYSEWLCIRESVKTTSVKPSGTVSLLAGATPGCHFPTFRYYLRRIRFSDTHPDVEAFREAGYNVEVAVNEPNTVVVEFPVEGDSRVKTERQVSLAEKMRIATLLQKHWADNQVSCTATFDPEREGHLIPDLLMAYDSRLKGISFLPLYEAGAFPQMPYESITPKQYEKLTKDLKPIVWPQESAHDTEDRFCDGPTCSL